MKKISMFIIACVGLALVLTAGFVMAEKDQNQPLNRAIIKIDSLSCGSCYSVINAGLGNLDGFSGMGANLFRKLIAVDFSAPLTQADIGKKLSDMGYPGELKSVEPISEKESFAYIESKRAQFSAYGGGCRGGSCGRRYAGKSIDRGPEPRVVPSSGSCCRIPNAGASVSRESL